jgi:LacI family transcriptional regulator
MEFLIGKGYRKIALISIQSDMAHMKDRVEAYYDVLNRHGITPDDRLVKLVPYDCERETALQEIMKLLTGSPGEIDAVFFLTNYLGVLGIEAIKKSGIRVPEQLAVLCFDDNDIFRLYTPTISVIRQPIADIGKKAMQALIERLKHTGTELQPAPINIKLPAELLPRESI